MSDERVLRAVMDDGRLTRAELATRTGLSKPTVSESVRRLTEAGLLRDTGERTSGRGRVGLYYALARWRGTALVVSVAPVWRGRGDHRPVRQVARSRRPSRSAGPHDRPRCERALVQAAEQACAGEPARLAVVSAADPVDRATGRLVHLPDAPFLVGRAVSGARRSPVWSPDR